MTQYQSTILTVVEVADLLQMTPQTVRRWAKEKKIPSAFRLGPRFIRFDEEIVRGWLKSRKKQVPLVKEKE